MYLAIWVFCPYIQRSLPYPPFPASTKMRFDKLSSDAWQFDDKKCEAKIEKNGGYATNAPPDRTRETKFKNARSRPESMYFLRK